MFREEEAKRTMGIHTIQVGESTQIFLGVGIKIKAKDKISTGIRVTHKGSNHG